jgi:hypothetical protein
MPSKLGGSTRSPHFHSGFLIKKNTNGKNPLKKEKPSPPQNQGKTIPSKKPTHQINIQGFENFVTCI